MINSIVNNFIYYTQTDFLQMNINIYIYIHVPRIMEVDNQLFGIQIAWSSELGATQATMIPGSVYGCWFQLTNE